MKTRITMIIAIIAIIAATQSIADTAERLIEKYKCTDGWYLYQYKDNSAWLLWCKQEDGTVIRDKRE